MGLWFSTKVVVLVVIQVLASQSVVLVVVLVLVDFQKDFQATATL
jgi:hypothetical protein